MSDMNFDLSPVEEKPSRKYRKGSKYDPIIDAFLESEHNLVTVKVEVKDANYLRTQLKKRIDARVQSTSVVDEMDEEEEHRQGEVLGEDNPF